MADPEIREIRKFSRCSPFRSLSSFLLFFLSFTSSLPYSSLTASFLRCRFAIKRLLPVHNNNIINNSTIERRLNKGIGKVAIKENKEAKKEERRWKNATQARKEIARLKRRARRENITVKKDRWRLAGRKRDETIEEDRP